MRAPLPLLRCRTDAAPRLSQQNAAAIIGGVVGGGGGVLCIILIALVVCCVRRRYALLPREELEHKDAIHAYSRNLFIPEHRTPSLDELAPGVKTGKARTPVVKSWGATPWSASAGAGGSAVDIARARKAGGLGAVSDGFVADPRSPRAPPSAVKTPWSSTPGESPPQRGDARPLIPPMKIGEDTPLPQGALRTPPPVPKH